MLESQLEKWVLSHASRSVPLRLVLPTGNHVDLGPSPLVTMTLKDFSTVRSLMTPTLESLGSAYVEGHIDLDGRLPDVLEVGVQLAQTTETEDFTEPSGTLLRKLLAHSKRRDKEAIEYHYDVSNEFYQLFLDEKMVYSCGYFERAEDTLEDAQDHKLDHILRKLQLKPGERFLDIGSGWGALIIRAAQRGAHAVGVTLSNNQYDYTRAKIREMGLEDRCEVRLQDYRDVPEVRGYDKIASIGMIEHVGTKNFGIYFSKIQELLAPGGAVLVHGITATDPDRRMVGRGGGNFIGRYVFPDGELPHISQVDEGLGRAGFEIIDVESLRRHYARTLTHWANRFEDHADEARRIAGEKRYRIWRMYLAGCAYGFAHNWMNIHQVLACRIGGPDENHFPMTRHWMYDAKPSDSAA